MELIYDEKHPPKNDVIFSIMFEDKELFSALLESVTGHVIDTDTVISQATMPPENINESYIRFDTYARDKDGTIYSLDLQNTYAQELLKNRTIYYACRAVSGQKVIKGNYKDLNEVVVSFIMTKKSKQNYIEVIRLYDENSMQPYSNLLTLYNVYVPSVNEAAEESGINENLRIFSAFFAINSKEDMYNFYHTYSESSLANKLLILYNRAIGNNELDNYEGKEFFQMKITEQDIAEAKVKYREIGKAEGIAEGKAEGIAVGKAEGIAEGIKKGEAKIIQKLKAIGHSIKEISSMFDMSEDEVKKLLAIEL